MNPGHEAIRLVQELNELSKSNTVVRAFITSSPQLAKLSNRARGIVIAASGVDGSGLRQRPANENRSLGWCSTCGSYHELAHLDPAGGVS